ncbi:MAG: hypothetical protein IJ772_06425 [Bacilli bacterium]|nr:hypothetical protein [Bacilli bacterium]MBR1818462.1 hypothetical protein [Bacilli bacterium]
MKVIQEKNKTIIILKDNETIEVQTLKKNPIRIQIKCKEGTFIVSENFQKDKARRLNKPDCN